MGLPPNSTSRVLARTTTTTTRVRVHLVGQSALDWRVIKVYPPQPRTPTRPTLPSPKSNARVCRQGPKRGSSASWQKHRNIWRRHDATGPLGQGLAPSSSEVQRTLMGPPWATAALHSTYGLKTEPCLGGVALMTHAKFEVIAKLIMCARGELHRMRDSYHREADTVSRNRIILTPRNVMDEVFKFYREHLYPITPIHLK